MRLTLVIASLGRGGAERTASVLAGGWAEQGKQVTLITLVRDDVPAYPLHPAIQLQQLRVRGGTARNVLHGIARQLKTVRALRRALRDSRPDVIVGFMDIPNVLTLFAARGMRTPVVITEHTHPAHYRIGRSWEMLRRLVYRRASVLVCVSSAMLNWFRSRTGARTRTIPNPVDVPSSEASNVERETDRVVLGMGRLTVQKGFDLLIEAFSRLALRYPEWSLKILGEGVERSSLQAQIDRLGLAGRVQLAGAVPDPFPVLRAADLFVLSSRFEGFGNALCEAMACGLPVISFDCPSGPAEIVRDGTDGILVPAVDVPALSEAMSRLMSDPQERARLGARATEVTQRFGLKRVLRMWDDLFTEALGVTAGRNTAAGKMQ